MLTIEIKENKKVDWKVLESSKELNKEEKKYAKALIKYVIDNEYHIDNNTSVYVYKNLYLFPQSNNILILLTDRDKDKDVYIIGTSKYNLDDEEIKPYLEKDLKPFLLLGMVISILIFGVIVFTGGKQEKPLPQYQPPPSAPPPPPPPYTETEKKYYNMILSKLILKETIETINNLDKNSASVKEFSIKKQEEPRNITYTSSIYVVYNYPAQDTERDEVGLYKKQVTLTKSSSEIEKAEIELQGMNTNNVNGCIETLIRKGFDIVYRKSNEIKYDLVTNKPEKIKDIVEVVYQCPILIETLDYSATNGIKAEVVLPLLNFQ